MEFKPIILQNFGILDTLTAFLINCVHSNDMRKTASEHLVLDLNLRF